MEGFRAGYAAIIGRPNVGKSTLLNAILGEKISIVSSKPQTTRDRLHGVYTDDRCQIVFVDTPGIIDPKDVFNEYLMSEAREALDGVDVVLVMIEANDREPAPPELTRLLRPVSTPLFLVVNKIDLAPAPAGAWPARGLEELRFERQFAVSATQRTGIAELVTAIAERLPEGEPFYDPDQLSDRDLRYLVSERVREKVLELTRQEIPYGVAARTEEFREAQDDRKTFIAVTIFVERESQKGIVIGKGAAMIQQIGREARPEIEALVGGPVFLELSVKVRKNWRKDPAALRDLGYAPKPRRRRR